MINSLDYSDVKFLFSRKGYSQIEKKNNICINVFGYENGSVYLVHVLDKKFEDLMDILLITDDNKSHYVYVKDFDRSMCNKTKNNYKKHFCSIFCSVLVVKRYW